MSDNPILSVPVGYRQALELYLDPDTDQYCIFAMAWDATGGVTNDAELWGGESLSSAVLALAEAIKKAECGRA